MAKVLNCGYARALVLYGVSYDLSKYSSHEIFDRIFVDYESRFANLPQFWHHEKRHLKERFKLYSQFIQKKIVDPALKLKIIQAFSDKEWSKLSLEEKQKHSLQDCTVRNSFFM